MSVKELMSKEQHYETRHQAYNHYHARKTWLKVQFIPVSGTSATVFASLH